MRRVCAVLLVIGLSSVGSGADEPDHVTAHVEPSANWTVSLRGAGPIHLGMSLTQVRRILGDAKARLTGPDSLDDCAYLESNRIPAGIGLMFAKKHLVRIDVFEGPAKTSAGAGIGDSEQRIKSLYRDRILVEPHPYVDEGHYLKYLPSGSSEPKLGMVFETDGRIVTSFRVGTLEAIALIEGCS